MTTMNRVYLAMAVLALGGAGCGEPRGPETSIGSCDARASAGAPGECLQWSGEETGDFEMLCTDTIGGTWSDAECPESAELIGTCFSDQLFGLFLTNYYYAPDFDRAAAEADCMEAGGGAGGAFTAR